MAKKVTLPRIKPKFTTADFLKGVSLFEQRMAETFLTFVQDKFKKGEYSFTAIEKVYGNGDTIDKEDLQRKVKRRGKVVFIENGIAIGELSYAEVFKILDHGRKDLGILPQPLIKQVFEDFRPEYKLNLKNFLLGKK